MNRPSPDDMKEIMMAELREKNKKLEAENFILWIMFFIFFVFSIIAAISAVYYKLN